MHEERTELSLRHVSSEILTTARMLPSRTNSPSAEVPQERIILESNRECGKGVMRTIFCNKTGLKLTRTNSKFYILKKNKWVSFNTFRTISTIQSKNR
jgi:hypothetical protein